MYSILRSLYFSLLFPLPIPIPIPILTLSFPSPPCSLFSHYTMSFSFKLTEFTFSFCSAVNVLSRQAEDREIQRSVMEKWAKGKLKPKLHKDRVYPIENTEGNKSGGGDQSASTSKFSILSFFRIPEKYINNKGLFVDVISRVFFPAAFVLFNIVFWSVYT